MMYIKEPGGILAVVLFASSCVFAQDPGWPREAVTPAGTLVRYAPQVDDWKNFTDLTFREAFTLTPTGDKQVVGAAEIEGATRVNMDSHIVLISNIKILHAYFPSLDSDTTAKMNALLLTFVPESVEVSLERIVAYTKKAENIPTVALKNDPPYIFISYSPAILLGVDGEPVLAQVPNTELKFVVNTQWPLFFETSKSKYFLLVGDRWLTASDLHGPWFAAPKLPKDMDNLPKDEHWSSLKNAIPPPAKSSAPIPKVFYSTVPAEVILFDGKPALTRIPQTQLSYATNTDSPLFLYAPKNEYYYLAAGRWFRSTNLEGQWTYASLGLPADFSNIPLSSPASAIRASVPGTEEAKDAVLIAQIPTVMEVEPKSIAAQVKVVYTGAPQFAPIQGTSLQYATNTPDKVIQVADVYYLCLQGVWFMSANPQGPWTTASSVPQVIYTILPSSPVYNVTYVTQSTTTNGNVQSSYTAGYLGAFVTGAAVGAIVANGTGYYYPPYVGYPAYGYPIYRPYPTPYGAYGYSSYYNTRTGAYGVSQTAYGPYGSATRAASYNPYTGTYKQGASVSTPYGRQSAGQAYNPYTGTYGATHQGSSPTSQWGQSYVSQGSKSAYTQHYSTAQGTVASAQGSQGGKAIGTSSAYGNTAAGKTSGGDMYAGHDGNVYKNTGSGWQKYDNGSWNSVSTQQAQQQKQNYEQQRPAQPSSTNAQQREQSFNQQRSSGNWSQQNLNAESQNRQRGAAQSQNWQRSSASGGGWGGGGRSWSGGHSGGRRR